jgi:hypothetical protein
MTIDNWKFHILASTPLDGDAYHNFNTGFSTICMVSVYGTATAYTLNFEAKGQLGTWCPISAWDAEKMVSAITATQLGGKLFKVDITGTDEFRVRISVISGGTLSVSGKIVG